MTKKLFLLTATVALATASAATHKVTLFQPSVFNGTELKPGEYKVEATGDKIVLTQGKNRTEAPGKVETAPSKFSSTSVRYNNSGGKYQVNEIRIGGTNMKLVVDLQAATQAGGSQ